MKYISIFLIVFFFPFILLAEEYKLPYKYFGIGDPGETEIWATIEKADLSVAYTHEGKLDIYVGPIKNKARYPITFKLEELEYFFKRQKHKKLIVVWFDKLALKNIEKIDDSIKKLNNYFFDADYKRVILLQSLSSGVGLYSDREKHI